MVGSICLFCPCLLGAFYQECCFRVTYLHKVEEHVLQAVIATKQLFDGDRPQRVFELPSIVV